MRELYCGYVSLRILYYERRYFERNKRKLKRVCCRLYPLILLDNKKEGLGNFLVDVAHTGCVSTKSHPPTVRG
jgi:hypothetical protein